MKNLNLSIKTSIILLCTFLVACSEVPRCDSEAAKQRMIELIIDPIHLISPETRFELNLKEITQVHFSEESGDRYCKADLYLHHAGEFVSMPIRYSFFSQDEEVFIKAELSSEADLEQAAEWATIRQAIEASKTKFK